jgi:hypothetical protein
MDRDPDGRMAEIQRKSRAAGAALRRIFAAADLAAEIDAIGVAEELLLGLRAELDELERESSLG